MTARLRTLHRHRATAIALILDLAPKASPTSRYRARAVWLIDGLVATVARIDAEIEQIEEEERERLAAQADLAEVRRLAGGRVRVVEDEAA